MKVLSERLLYHGKRKDSERVGVSEAHSKAAQGQKTRTVCTMGGKHTGKVIPRRRAPVAAPSRLPTALCIVAKPNPRPPEVDVAVAQRNLCLCTRCSLYFSDRCPCSTQLPCVDIPLPAAVRMIGLIDFIPVPYGDSSTTLHFTHETCLTSLNSFSFSAGINSRGQAIAIVDRFASIKARPFTIYNRPSIQDIQDSSHCTWMYRTSSCIFGHATVFEELRLGSKAKTKEGVDIVIQCESAKVVHWEGVW